MDRMLAPTRTAARSSARYFPAVLALGAAIVAACGGGNTITGPPLGTAAALSIVTAPPASIASRITFSTAPVIQLVDRQGTIVDSAGITVTAAIGSGGGTLGGSLTAVTNSSGQATFSNLNLRGTVGSYTIRFSSGTLTAATTGSLSLTPGTAATLTAVSAISQNGVIGQAVSAAPSVKASDLDGNGVSGVSVAFAVQTGGGSVTGGTKNTSGTGVATVTSWTLGGSLGSNTLNATAAGLSGSPVSFSATGVSQISNFNITVIFKTGTNPNASQRASFTRAEARWEQVITGDVGVVSGGFTTDPTCGNELMPANINDVVIIANLDSIDGPGKILGAAGPCYFRTSGSFLPYIGEMTFDTVDLAGLQAGGYLDDVILHEMGHVLGFGVLWDPIPGFWPHATYIVNVNKPPAISSLGFNGPNAVAAFVGSNGGSGTSVTVEDTSVVGTGRAHWKEANFKNELMTGYISGTTRPMSLTTVQSMHDLGYTVNAAAADPFNLATAGLEMPGAPTPLRVDLGHDIRRGPYFIYDTLTHKSIRLH